MFKKMFVQKRKEMIKEYEKQEKKIKEMKAHGSSKKQAVSSKLSQYCCVYMKIIISNRKRNKKKPLQGNRRKIGLKCKRTKTTHL